MMNDEQLRLISLSVALIRSPHNDQPRWLTLFNERSGLLEFVVAPRLGKESFRETVLREVAWQLELNRNRDFLVANMAQRNLDFTGMLPGDDIRIRYSIAFYNVELYRKRIVERLAKITRNVWVSSAEIQSGLCCDGRRIEPRSLELIRKSQVIIPMV